MEDNGINSQKVGLIGLIMIVVGSMIGSGVFNLPQGMASSAGVGASIIAWIITGVGVFFIAKVFQLLSNERADITGGIYYYAKNGFGTYMGFSSAWGYWLSNLIGNVSFAILLVNALTTFFPQIGGVDSLPGFIISSILIWGVIAFIAQGMKTANLINSVATVAKIVPIGLAIILLIIAFKMNIFTSDVWSKALNASGATHLGGVGTQVKNAMLQTLWVFVGVEGAVVISGRAKNSKDVGKATIIGYVFVLICYVLIVMLSFGIMTQEQLINVQTPALGGILKYTNGTWAEIMINIGVVISILGAWVSWTILTVETPMMVSKDKMFPKFLGKVNKNNAAVNALIFNGIIMEIAYIISMRSQNAFVQVTNTATTMILIPYLLSAGFLLKISIKDKKYGNMVYALGGVIYSVYMITTAGMQNLFLCFGLYGLGIIFLIIKSIENKDKVFDKKWEMVLCLIFIVLGICSFIF
ncbi:MAG: basic amino acid/polyamine antiporter [Clostridium sp.]|uniref:basic amino acid/polyamine antiporter n=1 Tax=Clostridium sp. TaxID=1506 RepID=UPI003F331227